MKHKTLYASPKYCKFNIERNRALERINLHAQTDVSRMLFERLDRITGYISHMVLQGEVTIHQLHFISKQLDNYIDVQFLSLIPLIEPRILRMRKATFIITYLGELEAIARATKTVNYISPIEFKLALQDQMAKPTILNKKWNVTLWNALWTLKQKIIQTLNRNVVQDKSPKEIVDAVKAAYPPITVYKRPPLVLKNLRESDSDDQDRQTTKKEFDFYGDVTTDEDWNLAVDAYKDTELPASRFDNNPSFDPDAGYARYNWELEQDMTDDFVSQVRDGQVEAATALGVKDFVWVSVIDNKTCDACCLPRNGKTISEIESMLSSGELSEDDCDATSPPAHPNCVPGSTFINLHYPILKVFRRRYTGSMASFITTDNRILQTTANHPILTSAGWKPAHEIKIGDYLVHPKNECTQVIDVNAEHMKITAEQIFDALSFFRFTKITTGLQSASDFHNDGTVNENVDIIPVDRDLILNGVTEFLKNSSDFLLKGSDLLLGSGHFNDYFVTLFDTHDSRVSFLSQCETFLFIHSTHSQEASLTRISRDDVKLQEPFSNSISVDRVFPSNTKFTHPVLIVLDRIFRDWQSRRLLSPVPTGGNLYSMSADILAEIVGMMPNNFSSSGQSETRLVKFDRVQDCFFRDFVGHVYNLETDLGWYIANNLIVHNCRCDLAPVANTDEVEGPDWKSFGEWLES